MDRYDYYNEGFKYLDERYDSITDEENTLLYALRRWVDADQIMTVIPFENVEVFPGMVDKYSTDEEIIRCVKALVKAIG